MLLRGRVGLQTGCAQGLPLAPNSRITLSVAQRTQWISGIELESAPSKANTLPLFLSSYKTITFIGSIFQTYHCNGVNVQHLVLILGPKSELIFLKKIFANLVLISLWIFSDSFILFLSLVSVLCEGPPTCLEIINFNT